MSSKKIVVTKAKVHNLKGISVTIPKETLTVITGPSGSGKSSLAFDTIYVEGQRRYIESLSSYARQFLGQYNPPDMESIEGLSPAIAIDQKTISKNPRSTVGTITEIYDYMRILYARTGTLYCPESGNEVRKFTPTQIVKELLKFPKNTKLQVLAPIKGKDTRVLNKEISKLLTLGLARIRLNGVILPLDNTFKLAENKQHVLEVVIDRILTKKGINKRLHDSIEYALKLGGGDIIVLIGNEQKVLNFSEQNKALGGENIYPDLEPRLFSFNSPLGACQTCNGIGVSKSFDENLMIENEDLSLEEGALAPLSNSYLYRIIECVAKAEKISIKKPYKKLPKSFRKILFHGTSKVYTYSFISDNSHWEFSKSFSGIFKFLEKKFRETGSERTRKRLEKWMKIKSCHSCNGNRLNPIALSTLIKEKNIMDLSALTVEESYKFFNRLKLTGEKKIIAEKILKEICSRLKFLLDVGLGYLTLDRPAMSLSGGEGQRIRLATQIGSALSGVLYVLDEPSIGLHQRDNGKLINTLKSLRDIGNTVLVVEHDEETMLASDHIIDLGPKAGVHGGEVILQASKKQFIRSARSLTAQYLNGKKRIPVPTTRREPKGFIKLSGAKQNNLKNLHVDIPLGGLVALTGVSGSGKSTLMHEIFVPACRSHLSQSYADIHTRDNYKNLTGVGQIKSIIELDQSPIGRTPKSNPATYTGVFSEIRNLYCKTTESQARGYLPGRFSFNVKGGRCEECEGNGVKKIEMHFLPDVYITCNECKGTRYNQETLSVLYKGKNISDVLKLSVEEALDFFKNHPKIRRTLDTINSTGLGYIQLGQPATTLSGGEAQRLKLSRELSKTTKGECLYVLDEPTTGLHFEDLKELLNALTKLIVQGHTVLVIEHNLDVIKSADYVIDLGPEGGDKGGKIIATGTPEEVAKVRSSHTGKYLKKALMKK